MKKFAQIAALTLLVVLTVAMLVACAYSSNPQKEKEKLEKDGYTIVSYDEFGKGDEYAAKIVATKSNVGSFTVSDLLDPATIEQLRFERLRLDYYNQAYIAKEAYEDECKKFDGKENYTVSRQGKLVIVQYVATGEAAKNAK